jgi:hypothetical protein
MITYLYSPVDSRDEKERNPQKKIFAGIPRRRPIKNSNTRIRYRDAIEVPGSRRSHLSDNMVHHPLRNAVSE